MARLMTGLQNTFRLLKHARFLGDVSPSAAARSSLGYNFELSPEQKEIQETSRKFGREVVLPVAAEYDRTGEYPWPIFKQAWELGLVNPMVPTDYGGLGLGLVEDVIISIEIGYGCTGIGAMVAANGLAQAPVIVGGSHETKNKYLSRMTEEPLVAVSKLYNSTMVAYS